MKNYNEQIESGKKHISANDPLLGEIIKQVPECLLRPRRNIYNAIIDSIISQQLSVQAAKSISYKFYTYFENAPTPEKIVTTDDSVLRSLGLSGAKVKYVKDFSYKILNKEIILKGINRKSDDEIIRLLTTVKGIGEWTVHMLLIFTLFRLDVLPVGDLGIRKAIQRLYKLRKLPEAGKIRDISKKRGWSPYCSIASWYLWRSLEIK